MREVKVYFTHFLMDEKTLLYEAVHYDFEEKCGKDMSKAQTLQKLYENGYRVIFVEQISDDLCRIILEK